MPPLRNSCAYRAGAPRVASHAIPPAFPSPSPPPRCERHVCEMSRCINRCHNPTSPATRTVREEHGPSAPDRHCTSSAHRENAPGCRPADHQYEHASPLSVSGRPRWRRSNLDHSLAETCATIRQRPSAAAFSSDLSEDFSSDFLPDLSLSAFSADLSGAASARTALRGVQAASIAAY